MSELILPGEQVPARHVNLKLGPGLIELSNVGQEGSIVSSKAGELKHSANNSRWWIESNSRRVRLYYHPTTLRFDDRPSP